jgi:hypothetical protein
VAVDVDDEVYIGLESEVWRHSVDGMSEECMPQILFVIGFTGRNRGLKEHAINFLTS